VYVDRQDRRKAQAVKVAGWFTFRAARAEDDPGVVPARVPHNMYGAMIRNASDLPVYKVRVWFVQGGVSSFGSLGILPPSEDLRFVALPNSEEWRLSADLDEDPQVELDFTDASGRHWRRAGSGIIEESAGRRRLARRQRP